MKGPLRYLFGVGSLLLLEESLRRLQLLLQLPAPPFVFAQLVFQVLKFLLSCGTNS